MIQNTLRAVNRFIMNFIEKHKSICAVSKYNQVLMRAQETVRRRELSRVSADSTNRRTRKHITSKLRIERPDAGDAYQQWRARLVQEAASRRGNACEPPEAEGDDADSLDLLS